MPENDREVFEKLTGADDSPAPIDFITYALFAFERREWIGHFEQRHGHPPSDAEIDGWISNFTDSQFQGLRASAGSFFDAAARAYLADEIEQGKKAVLETAIVSAVKEAGSFKKQFGIALLTAILAPLLIGAVIASALVFSDRVPSFRDIAAAYAARDVHGKSPGPAPQTNSAPVQ